MTTRQAQIEQIWHHEEEAKIKDKNISVSICLRAAVAEW